MLSRVVVFPLGVMSQKLMARTVVGSCRQGKASPLGVVDGIRLRAQQLSSCCGALDLYIRSQLGTRQ